MARGETDDIACWRLNRFARNVDAAIADVERIQAAGGMLAFVEVGNRVALGLLPA